MKLFAAFSVAGGLVHDTVHKPSGLEHMPVQLAAVPPLSAEMQPPGDLTPEVVAENWTVG